MTFSKVMVGRSLASTWYLVGQAKMLASPEKDRHSSRDKQRAGYIRSKPRQGRPNSMQTYRCARTAHATFTCVQHEHTHIYTEHAAYAYMCVHICVCGSHGAHLHTHTHLSMGHVHVSKYVCARVRTRGCVEARAPTQPRTRIYTCGGTSSYIATHTHIHCSMQCVECMHMCFVCVLTSA